MDGSRKSPLFAIGYLSSAILGKPIVSFKSLGFSFPVECFTKSYVAVNLPLFVYFLVSRIRLSRDSK